MASAKDIGKLIAVINPDNFYSDKLKLAKFKEKIKKQGFSDEVKKESSAKPLASYKLVYDAPTSQLEPIYFWLLDFMQEAGQDVEKITDNFTAAPGSGHFAEMGQRATRMQEEGMKILGLVAQVVKGIINLIYDLKEFEIRLGHYERAKSEDKREKEAGLLALKQIWLDNVDMKKGNTSVKAMAFSQASFSTLLDAFMIVEDEKMKMPDGTEIDLNDRVKRVLQQRIAEFNHWKILSEKELRTRFEVEKSYLKSQVGTLKLYTSWVKPYLKAAEELRNKGFDRNPALVNAFNTAMFELVLISKSKVDFNKAVNSKKLPVSFINYKPKRTYYAYNVVSLVFRGIPQRVTQQHYGFGGRVEITFDSYTLNDDELNLLKKELEKEDLEAPIKFVQETTDESLKQLQEDIDRFVKGDEEKKKDEKKKQEKKKEDDINPFTAIADLFKEIFTGEKKAQKGKAEELKDLKGDDYIEKHIRKLAGDNAKSALYALYDIYKKAHGHASSPEPFDS